MEAATENAEEESSKSIARWETWQLVALAIVCAILVASCFTWPLHVDEAYSVLLVRHGLGGIFHMLAHDTNLPLYFLILHFWIKLAGTSEIALRIPSVPFYLLATWVTMLIARQASGSARAGLYAAFFYVASSEAIYQSMLARPYALLGLLAAFSTFFFLKAFILPTRSRASEWAYFAANVAGTFTHVWFFFLLPAQALAVLIFLPRRRWWRVAANQIASLIPFAVLWGPALPMQMRNGGTSWMPHLNFAWAASALTKYYVGHRVGAAFLLVCLLLVLVRPKGLSRAIALIRKSAYATLVITVVVSLGVPLLISLVRPIYYPNEYSIIALPALAAGLGWALSDLASRRWLAAWCCLIVAGYGTVAALQVTGQKPNLTWLGDRLTPVYRAGADRAAAGVVCRRARPGDWLVFTSLSRTAMQYYLGRQGCLARFHFVTFPASVEQHPGWDWAHRNPAKLEVEARHLGLRLAAATTQNGPKPQIWVFWSYQQQENVALKKSLMLAFRRVRMLPLRGAMFHGISVYKTRGALTSKLATSHPPGTGH